MIALDRPGFGRSDACPGRELSDWPRDVADAADGLGLERFAVAGCSGGGPFAAACAAGLPDRLTSVGILCGLGPPESRRSTDGMMWHNRLGLSAAQRVPWLAHALFVVLGRVLPRLSGLAIANLRRHSTGPDREALSDPEVSRILSRAFREAFARGGAGAAADARIFGRPWDFDPAAIRVPVRVWHGERDAVVPVSAARWMRSAIRGAEATYFPDEGHFSLVTRRLDEIFDALRRSFVHTR